MLMQCTPVDSELGHSVLLLMYAGILDSVDVAAAHIVGHDWGALLVSALDHMRLRPSALSGQWAS